MFQQINIQCENFKQKIIEDINSSNLPPVVAYYILENCLFQLKKVCQEVLNEELKDSSKKETKTVEIDLLDEETKKTLQRASISQEQLQKIEEAE